MVVLAGATPGRLPAPVFADIEFLAARVGGGGGPIDEVLLVDVFGFVTVLEAGLAAGVEVRGVEEVEFADDPSCFVGDFVGD